MDNFDLYKRLLLEDSDSQGHTSITDELQKPKTEVIVPKPGFCIKTKTDKDEKVFINLCYADNIPAPKHITDEDLMKLLESEDQSGYRVPMSLGEPHAEMDNNGAGCTAYDVVLNHSFFEELLKRQILLGFVLTVLLEGLEYKYSISLCREWKMLKNRKFMGKIGGQNIRTEQKPLILDLDSNETNLLQSKEKTPLISEIKSSNQNTEGIPRPLYSITKEPATGHPEFLVAEINLPKLKVAASMTLDVGGDRLLLTTRSKIYHLDIYLPYDIVQEEVGAQFNRQSKVLTIVMPVEGQVV